MYKGRERVAMKRNLKRELIETIECEMKKFCYENIMVKNIRMGICNGERYAIADVCYEWELNGRVMKKEHKDEFFTIVGDRWRGSLFHEM